MGSGPSPVSHGVFLQPPLLQAFLLLVAGHVPPLLPSKARSFTYSSVRDCLSPLFRAQGAPPSLLCVFFVVTAYYSVFFYFFSLGGGQSVQRAMLIWPRVVCGNTACRLAHLVVCVFPSGLGAGHQADQTKIDLLHGILPLKQQIQRPEKEYCRL
jgi:hypothetical protein